ncbi:MAG: 50S ribosomal protein L6 [Eubacteriales bacterium]|jgi:large subunit ribosomal protein L6|nr:50S ribosomal protein L6 [Eubacteriales bacterium]MDD4326663.1 50S ribosomal protein L6 [Eubacteriales bacterium]MDD4716995.1 50S ribosomal protein L6 [Eubacteriales bacterium]NCU25690.1 50S ribosomal protein L6 [Candidatus Nomurabacteria bacterium]
MSRIGNKKIVIPAGVEVRLNGSEITVKGPKASLKQIIHSDISVKIDGNVITVTRPTDEKNHKALHGLTRSLINNMVIGVSEGYKKTLEIQGIGFKAVKQGNKVVLNLGYSHQIEMEEPEGITLDVPAPNRILVSGSDKQVVGETAAKLRSFRVPDAYHGKGIKYDYEVLKLKEGKTGSK